MGSPCETTSIAAAIIAASASDSVGTPARRTCVAAGAAIATKSGRIAAGGAPTAAARALRPGPAAPGSIATLTANAANAAAIGSFEHHAAARIRAGDSGRPTRCDAIASSTVDAATVSTATPVMITQTPTSASARSIAGALELANDPPNPPVVSAVVSAFNVPPGSAATDATAAFAAFAAAAAPATISPLNHPSLAADAAATTTNAPPPFTSAARAIPATPRLCNNHATQYAAVCAHAPCPNVLRLGERIAARTCNASAHARKCVAANPAATTRRALDATRAAFTPNAARARSGHLTP